MMQQWSIFKGNNGCFKLTNPDSFVSIPDQVRQIFADSTEIKCSVTE